jgi:hypothetical protein
MSSFRTAIDLPTPGSGCGDIRVAYYATSLYVDFEYRLDGNDLIGQLAFDDVVAFRFRKEMYSAGFEPESYDRLLVSDQSPWLQELKKIEPSGLSDLQAAKHFALFLSSNGYLEVVATKALLKEARRGLLDKA